MHNANVQQRTQTRSTHKPHTASFDFAHFTFTACPQTEKQAYLWLFRSSSTLQQQEKMSWSLILVSSNRIGIKMWHFTTPVTCKCAAALLLLCKWWALTLQMQICLWTKLHSCTISCFDCILPAFIRIHQNIALQCCALQRWNNSYIKVLTYSHLSSYSNGCDCCGNLKSSVLKSSWNSMQLAIMAMLMLPLLLAMVLAFLWSSYIMGKVWK